MLPANNGYMKEAFNVVYRCYYEAGVQIAESAPEIIRMSGNERIQLPSLTDYLTGNKYEYFGEVLKREHYCSTMIDSRSYSQKQQGQTIGEIYERYGLPCDQTPGTDIDDQIPSVRDELALDYSRNHPITDQPGVPRLFVFDCCQPLIDEIEGYPLEVLKRKKKPDHALSCLRYWASAFPAYSGGHEDEPQYITDSGYAETRADRRRRRRVTR